MITYILIKHEIFFQSSVDLLNVLKYKVTTANCLLCPTNSRKCKGIQFTVMFSREKQHILT